MIKVENIDVWGFEHAIRGMRNPMNSWDKSDSLFPNDFIKVTRIGKNDLDLMKRLYKAGTEHRKYLRQIFVSMDITAPLYWWKEMDQYRINVTTNSCSTMHKIAAKEFTLDDFSHEHLHYSNTYNDPYCVGDTVSRQFEMTIFALNKAREQYLKTKNKEYWWFMIQTLPSSYNQKRTITMNYENVVTIIKQRSNHKLDEWRTLVNVFYWELPYIKEIVNAD